MFGKPRQLATEAGVYDAAIKILMRRAHSVSEMKKALGRRCEDEKIVKGVVERLKREKSNRFERLMAIADDCARRLRASGKFIDIDELLYDENGLPK